MINKGKKIIFISKQGRFYTSRIQGLSKSIKMHKNKREALMYASIIAKKYKWQIKEIN